jgi:hypothetical protein
MRPKQIDRPMSSQYSVDAVYKEMEEKNIDAVLMQ